MNSDRIALPTLSKAYKNTVKSIKDYPVILIPFAIFALVELVVLCLIFLSPRMPFKLIFGPPIRTFWGEIYLHYPANFLLLPKLASQAKMVLSVILSSVLTATAIFLVADINNKKRPNLAGALKGAFKKYIYFFAVFFIVTVLFYALIKFIDKSFINFIRYLASTHRKFLFLKYASLVEIFIITIHFIIAIFIQSLFIYALPILIIGKEKLFKSIIKSFVFFKGFFFKTLILVGLPMLLYIPMIALNQNTNFLINKFFPEIILLVSFLNIIISSLIVDPIVTVSTTFLYLAHSEKS